jgi:hypothetical protein
MNKIYIICYQDYFNNKNNYPKQAFYNKEMALNNLDVGGTIYELYIDNINQDKTKLYVLMEISRDKDILSHPIKISFDKHDFDKYFNNKEYKIYKTCLI